MTVVLILNANPKNFHNLPNSNLNLTLTLTRKGESGHRSGIDDPGLLVVTVHLVRSGLVQSDLHF